MGTLTRKEIDDILKRHAMVLEYDPITHITGFHKLDAAGNPKWPPEGFGFATGWVEELRAYDKAHAT